MKYDTKILMETIFAFPGKLIQSSKKRFDKSPIDSTGKLSPFLQTRSAYIAQTAMFGYLKARMGTRFATYFHDPNFAPVIRDASTRLFAVCLSDLTLYATARLVENGKIKVSEAKSIARCCFTDALETGLKDIDMTHLIDKEKQHFETRLKHVDWAAIPHGLDAFSHSIESLIQLAPVVDTFKELDKEIVTNSIRFRWRDIKEQLLKRLDAAAVVADWKQHNSNKEK